MKALDRWVFQFYCGNPWGKNGLNQTLNASTSCANLIFMVHHLN